MFYFLKSLDELCWDASHDGVGFNIFGDHRTSTYNGILAYGNTRQDSGASTYPAITLQNNGLAGEYLVLLRIVVVGDELRIGCYHHIILNGDAACAHE